MPIQLPSFSRKGSSLSSSAAPGPSLSTAATAARTTPRSVVSIAKEAESGVRSNPCQEYVESLPEAPSLSAGPVGRLGGIGCGVGMMLNVDEHSHEFKVVALSPGGPAQRSGLVRVGDVILKIEGQPLRGLTPQQVVDLITGPRDTQVELLIQSPIVYDVHTAHFQELPFTGVRDKKSSNGAHYAGSQVYGAGHLPAGFEHLEELRSTQPYTSPSLSVRTVQLVRAVAGVGAQQEAASIPPQGLHGSIPPQSVNIPPQAVKIEDHPMVQSPVASGAVNLASLQELSPCGAKIPDLQHLSVSPETMGTIVGVSGPHAVQATEREGTFKATADANSAGHAAQTPKPGGVAGSLPEKSDLALDANQGQVAAKGDQMVARAKAEDLQAADLSPGQVGARLAPHSHQFLQPAQQAVLLLVAGAKACFVSRVSCTASQLSDGGVYVAWGAASAMRSIGGSRQEAGQAVIYVWHGANANTQQRVKALELAAALKDREMAARASIVRLESDDMDEGFWTVLGGCPGPGSSESAASPTPEEQEEAFYARVQLLVFSDSGCEDVRQRPLRRALLRHDCLVVLAVPAGVSGNEIRVVGRVWLWTGKQASEAVITQGRAKWLQMQGDGVEGEEVHDSWESSEFRAQFVDWLTPCGTAGKSREVGIHTVGASQLAQRAGAHLATAGGGGVGVRRGSRRGSPVEAAGLEMSLVRLRGRKFVTAVECQVAADSVNGADVFILNVPARGTHLEKGEAGAVYQRTGARASMHAKALAGQIAAAFVGTHAGRASLAVIDHDDDDSAAGRAFWKAIGEAKPACLPDIDAAQEDAFEQRAKGLIRLLRVDGGSQVESLHEECEEKPRPWVPSALTPESVFVLHWPNEQLWVWTGKRASISHKEQGFAVAAALQRDDPSTPLRATSQFAEPPLFRAHFKGWSCENGGAAANGVGPNQSRHTTKSDKSQPPAPNKDRSTLVLEERASRIDVEEMEAKPATSALLTPAIKHDDGEHSELRVWAIVGGKLVPLAQGAAEEAKGAQRPLWLSSEKCYVALYLYSPGIDRRQTRRVIYCWHGRQSSRTDRASCTMCMNEVSTLAGGGERALEDRQVLLQGKESKHFVIAAGRLLLVSSGLAGSGAAPARVRMWVVVDMGTGSASSPTHMVSSCSGQAKGGRGLIESSSSPVGKLVEIEPRGEALYSGACYLVLERDAMPLHAAGKPPSRAFSKKLGYIWQGWAARDGALQLAMRAVQRMLSLASISDAASAVHIVPEHSPASVLFPLYTLLQAPEGGECWYAQLSRERLAKSDGLGSRNAAQNISESASSEAADECSAQAQLGITRLFHLEAAGHLLRPREVLNPDAEDLDDAADGLCLVDRIDPMRAGGDVYVWHSAKSPPPARLQQAVEMATKYLAARNRRLALPLEAEVQVVQKGHESPLFQRCFHTLA